MSISKRYNIVIGTAVAGAGHWRQAERLRRHILAEPTISPENKQRISFLTIDKTQQKAKKLSDLSVKWYPFLQKNPFLMKLLNLYLNSRAGRKVVDKSVLEMGDESAENIKQQLAISVKENRFDPNLPTIFLSTHTLTAQGFRKLVEERRNPDDWVFEFLPDPWKDSQLRAMASPEISTENWVVVLHDEETVKEYRKIRPNIGAKIVVGGTISSPYATKRRKQLMNKSAPQRNHLDIFIECSGHPVPAFDSKVAKFLSSVVNELKNGKVRIVIDPMLHEVSHKTFSEALNAEGLSDCKNILLLDIASDLESAVNRREDIIEGINQLVNEKFMNSFDPFAVIAKSGEVPLEDRADMIVFCPHYTVMHEERDLLFGVREGRAVDATKIEPSEWMSELMKLYDISQRGEWVLPAESRAHRFWEMI